MHAVFCWGLFGTLEKECEGQLVRIECKRGHEVDVLSTSEWGKLNNKHSFDRAGENPFFKVAY